MTASPLSLAGELERLYQEWRDHDPPFSAILQRIDIENDERLAELIEADGRRRIRDDRSVDLDRYLVAVHDLRDRPDPLDAALDMALRGLVQAGCSEHEAMRQLIDRHQELATPIREAAALGSAIWSTTQVHSQLTEPTAIKTLPCDFGPIAEGVCRYELIELLGAGAFGEVYRAIDRQLSEEDHAALVSVKVLPVTEFDPDRDPWARQRFIDEATKARRIDHRNVVRVIDRGTTDDDEDFIVYEFVDGGDLSKWMARHDGPLPLEKAVQLASAIARGVHAAHMAGLVHCDLKPNNIVLTGDGVPKVADFGVAIRANEADTRVREAGSTSEPLGNLAFMSPEQFRMEPGAVTIPSDLFALGGILFWLITDTLPNGVDPESIRATHDRAAGRKTAPAVRDRRRNVSRDLEAIVQRALAPNASDRFPSAAAFADSLDAWLARKPVAWTNPSIARRAWLFCRRRPALAVAAGLALALAVAAGMFAVDSEISKQANRTARNRLLAYGKKLEKVHAEGSGHEVLFPLWFLDWVYDPAVLDSGPGRIAVWNLRIDLVRGFVASAEERGETGTLEHLIWKTLLGFWLIRDCKYDEANAVLDDVVANMDAIVPVDDPIRADIAALLAASVVGSSEGDVPAIQASAMLLEMANDRLTHTRIGSPIHMLVLDSLLTAYAPDRLDEPDLLDAIATQIETIDK